MEVSQQAGQNREKLILFPIFSAGHMISDLLLEQISTFLSGSFGRGRSEKKYYIVPHLTKFVRGCPICRDILKLIS